MWLKEIEMYSTNKDVITLLVGNKVDKTERAVSREEGAKFAKNRSMIFIECSAKTKLGVQQAFEGNNNSECFLSNCMIKNLFKKSWIHPHFGKKTQQKHPATQPT
jgi:hypothetical protein